MKNYNYFNNDFQASEDEIVTALNAALEAGYRHIDCAPAYLNEKAIGKTLKKWIDSGKVTREELFIVTKVKKKNTNKIHLLVKIFKTYSVFRS